MIINQKVLTTYVLNTTSISELNTNDSHDLSSGLNPLKPDLHCHTYCSDGDLSPQALIELAEQSGIDLLAITDHDTLDGYFEAKPFAESAAIQLVPAIEWSAVWGGMSVHVVGLNLDPNDSTLTEQLTNQRTARIERAREIGRKLAKVGIEDAYSGARNLAPMGQIGRPHFARYLLEKGYVKNYQEAFKKYLGAGKLGDVKTSWPQLEEVVAWTRQAGGVAVLAHPKHYKLTRSKLGRLIEAFAEAGGEAIELVTSPKMDSTDNPVKHFAQLYGLAVSVASDFHTPQNGWQHLGGLAKVPEPFVPVWQMMGEIKK